MNSSRMLVELPADRWLPQRINLVWKLQSKQPPWKKAFKYWRSEYPKRSVPFVRSDPFAQWSSLSFSFYRHHHQPIAAEDNHTSFPNTTLSNAKRNDVRKTPNLESTRCLWGFPHFYRLLKNSFADAVRTIFTHDKILMGGENQGSITGTMTNDNQAVNIVTSG